MVILRRLAPFTQLFILSQRFYARKLVATTNVNMKQIHQETLRYINPHAKIKINSDIYVKVSSADPHRYPSGDALIAELHGGPAKNCTASMDVNVSDDECNVEIVLKKLNETTDFHCEIAVPIKASLNINSRYAASVKDTFGDELKVKAVKFLNCKNVRAERIELLSTQGNISCQGILLGKETKVETQNKGNIILDKLQGDAITCKTNNGNITTNCSYVESSKFETNAGCLDLKNVHKKSVVLVNQKGDLKMTGVHGNLKVFINEGNMNLQLSELQGENIIEAKNLSTSVINISDDIEKNTMFDVNLTGDVNTSIISLDASLEHLSSGLSENKQQFQWPLSQKQQQPNKLNVVSKNSLTLGKSSWMEMMRLKMAKKQNDQK
ncbi:protein FAM185A [Cochliomyia hominivorax]